MFLFATAQSALPPYECFLAHITTPEVRAYWIDYAQRELNKFLKHFPSDSNKHHGIETLLGCLQLSIPGLETYVSCLLKPLPYGIKGPQELVMTMGAFTQNTCPLSFHMGISRTFSAFSERRTELSAGSDLMPASIFMHVLTARAIHALHPELIYTCSIPLPHMLKIFHQYLGGITTIGYKEQQEDLATIKSIVEDSNKNNPTRENKANLDHLNWVQATSDIYNITAKPPLLSVNFKDVNSGNHTEAPQYIDCKMPDGTWQTLVKRPLQWFPVAYPFLYERPFYPSQGVLGLHYITVPITDLKEVNLAQRIILVKAS